MRLYEITHYIDNKGIERHTYEDVSTKYLPILCANSLEYDQKELQTSDILQSDTIEVVS
jgi:hypothetical protein